MPIYGYRCESCGHQLEVRQSLSDEPLRVCPECKGPLRKLLYPAGVIFKGSGFYTTDYKKSGSTTKATKPSSNGDSGGASTGPAASSSSEAPSSGAAS